jgi:hypothetical protein
MSKIYLVLIKLKSVSEGEGIVVSSEANIFLLVVVLKIGDITANTMPTSIIFPFCSG